MKKIFANYVALNYNSQIGYSLLIQELSPHDESSLRINCRATFGNSEDCLEYLEFKAGKVISRSFTHYFELIRQLIVNEPDIRREIISDFYVLEGGRLNIKKVK